MLSQIAQGEVETRQWKTLDMARIRHHVSLVCTKRGQATSAVEGGSKTTKASTRRYVL